MPSLESDSDRRGSDEADPELVELLRQHLGLGGKPNKAAPPETKVLEGAQYIFDNSIDVALSPTQVKEAAEMIWRLMQKKAYSTLTWSEHELHPQAKTESTVDFIFAMDLLNFSFWSEEKDESKRFCIEYRGRKWTGYWSLVAALQRALDEGMSHSDAVWTFGADKVSHRYPNYYSRLLGGRGGMHRGASETRLPLRNRRGNPSVPRASTMPA
jgi:hypothetical protein